MENETASLVGLHQAIQNQDELLAQRDEELRLLRQQVAANRLVEESRQQLLALIRRLQPSGRSSWPWMRVV